MGAVQPSEVMQSIKNNDLDHIWNDLRTGIELVFQGYPLSRIRYMQLYTHVFNYCTQVTGGREKMGQEIYNKLKEFLDTYQVSLQEKGSKLMDESLLKFYADQWQAT